MSGLPDRMTQVAMMANARERMTERLRRWLGVPAYREALHAYDGFLAKLTPEQRERALSNREPDNYGPDNKLPPRTDTLGD